MSVKLLLSTSFLILIFELSAVGQTTWENESIHVLPFKLDSITRNAIGRELLRLGRCPSVSACTEEKVNWLMKWYAEEVRSAIHEATTTSCLPYESEDIEQILEIVNWPHQVNSEFYPQHESQIVFGEAKGCLVTELTFDRGIVYVSHKLLDYKSTRFTTIGPFSFPLYPFVSMEATGRTLRDNVIDLFVAIPARQLVSDLNLSLGQVGKWMQSAPHEGATIEEKTKFVNSFEDALNAVGAIENFYQNELTPELAKRSNGLLEDEYAVVEYQVRKVEVMRKRAYLFYSNDQNELANRMCNRLIEFIDSINMDNHHPDSKETFTNIKTKFCPLISGK